MTEWIITSSATILIMLLLRAVFRKRISARLQYTLWSLVLLRLLIPFSLSSTPISIMNFVVPAEQAAVSVPESTPSTVESSEAADTSRPVSNYQPPLPQHNNESSTPNAATPHVAIPSADTTRETAAKTEFPSISMILRGIWLAGSIAMLVWLTLVHVIFYRRLRHHRIRQTEIDCLLPVYRCTAIVSPCLFGCSIYITPQALDTPERLQHVLTHGLCHWEQKDFLWAMLRGACLILWWWNPLVWIAAVLSRRDCEAACDERVVRKLGEAQRLAYGTTLVDMIAVQTAPTSLLCSATTMTSRDMHDRLKLLVQRRKVWLPAVVAVMLLAALCVGCTFTGAQGNDSDLRETTLTFQGIGKDGLLATLEGTDDAAEPVRVRPNDLLSEDELASLQAGDILTVTYRNRTAGEIDAVSITIEHVGTAAPPEETETPSSSPSKEPSDTPPTEQQPEENLPAAPDNEPTTEAPTYTPEIVTPENEASLIAFFEEELFGGSGFNLYRQALTSSYASAAKLDLQSFLYHGVGNAVQLNWELLSASEQSALRKSAYFEETWLEADIVWFGTAQINDALQSCFGLTLADIETIGMQDMLYLPEFDLYYVFQTDEIEPLSIDVTSVNTDAEGYYYLNYRRAGTSGNEPNWVCCLTQVGDSWRIVYNLESPEDLVSGAAAQVSPSSAAFVNTRLRPMISNDLEQAISNVLVRELQEYIPDRATLWSEAHDVLTVQWQGDELCVYAVTAGKAYENSHNEITEIDTYSAAVKLVFYPWHSSGRIFYELVDLVYSEDPAASHSIFPGESWLDASDLTMELLTTTLLQQCDEQLPSLMAPFVSYDIEALYASLSGRSPEEAAENAINHLGAQLPVTYYLLFGSEENIRITEEAVEGLLGSDLAASFGWSDEYVQEHIKIVDVTYSIEHDHSMTWEGDGVFIMSYYLCEDPDSGMWRVWDHGSAIELVTYQTNHN